MSYWMSDDVATGVMAAVCILIVPVMLFVAIKFGGLEEED